MTPPRTLPASKAGVTARHAIDRASELACMVRDEGADAIGGFLDDLDRQALYALTVTLAAMVDIDRSPDELLAWIHENRLRVVA